MNPLNNNLFTLLGLETTQLNMFPETNVEEILQNITVIITTVRGTVPLDRDLGLDVTFIDEPSPRAKIKASIHLLETIQDYEPRVEVTDVDFIPKPNDALDGRFYPKVTVRILDEYLS